VRGQSKQGDQQSWPPRHPYSRFLPHFVPDRSLCVNPLRWSAGWAITDTCTIVTLFYEETSYLRRHHSNSDLSVVENWKFLLVIYAEWILAHFSIGWPICESILPRYMIRWRF